VAGIAIAPALASLVISKRIRLLALGLAFWGWAIALITTAVPLTRWSSLWDPRKSGLTDFLHEHGIVDVMAVFPSWRRAGPLDIVETIIWLMLITWSVYWMVVTSKSRPTEDKLRIGLPLQDVEFPIAVRVEGVTQRFRVIHERPDTLRELFSKFLRHEVNFHDFDAVSNVSLEVKRGEMVGIIGRNGSGKSTLLKIDAGVYKPTAGRVEIHGTVAPLIELGAGFHHELTGRENILLNGLLMGYTKEEMLRRESRIIEFAEIGEFIDAPVKQYSSGMHTRLAFAVATEVDPDILIIDEILAVGDASFQEKCFARIKHFRESGKTILFVSHNMQQITSQCDRAILLEHGTILEYGDPKEVVGRYHALWSVEPAPAG
jgi:ABC-type polysaccharide/polyol phosphate transport system ATPase subunit